MKAKTREQLVDAIKIEIEALIDQESERIYKIFDLQERSIEFGENPDKKFKCRLAIGVELREEAVESYVCDTTLGWDMRQKSNKGRLRIVRTGKDMVDIMEQAAKDAGEKLGLDVTVGRPGVEPAPSAKAMAGLMAPKRRGRPAKGARAAGGTGQIFGDEDAAGN